jgi:oligopeptidase B
MKSIYTSSFSCFLLLVAVLFSSCQNQNSVLNTPDPVGASAFGTPTLVAPTCEMLPKTFADGRVDEYYWLNQRENPKVKAFLEAENQYFDSIMAPMAANRALLFDEMKARIKEDDSSVPYFKNGYYYFSKFETGKEYPVYCRKKGSMDGTEEVLIDANEIAKGHEYSLVTELAVSPDNTKLFYMVDYTGRNLFKWYVRDLSTGKDLVDSGSGAESGAVWAKDSKSFLYSTKDPVTLRFDKIWHHTLGQPAKKDVLKHFEKDDTQYAYLSGSKSGNYAFINAAYTQVVEVAVLDMSKPSSDFKVVRPREKGVYYNLEDAGNGQFLVRTNMGGSKNFKIMSAPVTDPRAENWKEFLAHSDDVLIEDFSPFKDYLAVAERRGGQNQIRIIKWADKSEHNIDFGEKAYQAGFGPNPEFDTKTLRYVFSSPRTPQTTIDYNLDSRNKEVKKVAPVLGGYDPNNYETDYIWANAPDGTKVPMSLVYKKGMAKNGKNQCYLIGYGSYGFSYDPSFNRDQVSLLDRGFVIAIAHIRGGMEMGYKWYEQGKLNQKMNTFTDFIACAEHLIAQKYTEKDRLFASGRSAGGLLMGAVTNMRPDLFKGIIAGVPFVDVLTTMGDPTIPLTTGEYTEWGNPADPAAYATMKKYSPYDNIEAKAYPNLLVLSAFEDSQVQYFEPAKWVARLRTKKTDKNLLLMHTQMAGSHGGSSGRFKRLEDRALEYSWMMGLLGMQEGKTKG